MEGKPISTPIVIGYKLSKDDDSREVDKIWYRSMIGILMYVISFRLDIMQDVGMLARFQSDQKETHALAIKGISKYLKGTMELGIWYPRDGNFSFISYFDVD